MRAADAPRARFTAGGLAMAHALLPRYATAQTISFTDQRIKDALAASGTPIERVGGRFLSDGRVRYAWFMSTHGAPFATSWALEYDPEGTRAPGPAGMVTLTPVEGEQDWWFACCAD